MIFGAEKTEFLERILTEILDNLMVFKTKYNQFQYTGLDIESVGETECIHGGFGAVHILCYQ